MAVKTVEKERERREGGRGEKGGGRSGARGGV